MPALTPSLDAQLRRSVLFADLPEAALAELARLSAARSIQRDEFFFYQGDPAARVYLLTGGKVKLTQTGEDGQQVVMQVIGQGTVFGAIALAGVASYPVAAEAMEGSSAISWDQRDLLELIHRYGQLGLNALRVLAGHVQEFQERLRQLSTERVERRVARAVLRLASQVGRKVEGGVLVDLPLTRQDLAEMTGTTLYTVSRILSQWEAQGLVDAGRERVMIRFPHGLVAIAEDLPRPARPENAG